MKRMDIAMYCKVSSFCLVMKECSVPLQNSLVQLFARLGGFTFAMELVVQSCHPILHAKSFLETMRYSVPRRIKYPCQDLCLAENFCKCLH